MNRRHLHPVLAIALCAAPLLATAQQPAPYPAKPIRLILPATPGSPADLLGRLIGERLSARLGQSLVFDNRPGATGILGLAAVAKSTPDGYTIGIIAMPYVVMANLVPKMPHDIYKDLAPVALISWHYNVAAVAAHSPARSVAGLIEAAKAKPGALKFSSSGNGTISHLAGELFKREAGVDITHIPYKGAPAAVLALLAGDVDMIFGPVGALSSHIRDRRLRPLATTGGQRIAAYPELPTFVELGYPGLQIRDWLGLVAPAGSPGRVIARLNAEVARTTAMRDVQARLEAFGMVAASASPEQFRAHIRSEMRRWAELVRAIGIRVD